MWGASCGTTFDAAKADWIMLDECRGMWTEYLGGRISCWGIQNDRELWSQYCYGIIVDLQYSISRDYNENTYLFVQYSTYSIVPCAILNPSLSIHHILRLLQIPVAHDVSLVWRETNMLMPSVRYRIRSKRYGSNQFCIFFACMCGRPHAHARIYVYRIWWIFNKIDMLIKCFRMNNCSNTLS